MWKQLQNMFSKEEDYSRLNNLDETFTSFCRTPLHIAVMSGDIKFATKILSQKPDLALKQDSNGFTPLHLASVRTNIHMVKLLLKAKSGACIVQDEDERTPLHLAAMKNRVEIMKVLMEEGLTEAIHLKNDHKDTILHLCVRSNSTIELLVNKLVQLAQTPYPYFINSIDNDGNTILHLATEMGNLKITNFLLLNSNVRIDINVVNEKGIRALSMLSQDERNDLEFGFYDYHVRHEKHKSKTLSKNDDYEAFKDRVNALMVVATLIAGIAFQAAMNPPGGVWQDDSKIHSGNDPVTFAYYLNHMYGSSMSGGWGSYIGRNYPGAPYSSVISFLDSLKMRLMDAEYLDMTLGGLILKDTMFTKIVSQYTYLSMNYNTSGDKSSVFFPYLIRYAGYPVLAYTYPTQYVTYMATTGIAFFMSLTIIFLVICGFLNERSVAQVRTLVVLMCISVGCISFGYLSILQAMVPDFYTQAVNVMVGLHIFLGVCCMLGVGYFIWTLKRMIVKLRKRTEHHRIGVMNYLKALFFGMDSKAAGKLSLLIVSYCGFRLTRYLSNGDWYHIHPILF